MNNSAADMNVTENGGSGALQQRFEFRNIRSDEALQTAEIERICFPPNEACSEKMMVERVNRAPGIFSGGCGQGDRKDRGVSQRSRDR